jgi:hypothetical protein
MHARWRRCDAPFWTELWSEKERKGLKKVGFQMPAAEWKNGRWVLTRKIKDRISRKRSKLVV